MDGEGEAEGEFEKSSLLVGEAEGEEEGGFLPVSVLHKDISIMNP